MYWAEAKVATKYFQGIASCFCPHSYQMQPKEPDAET